jgi:hypothetical protein
VSAPQIDVRRVAFRFYTWRFEWDGKATIGFGAKSHARAAARRFLMDNGGELV